jgi:hypothetical protein
LVLLAALLVGGLSLPAPGAGQWAQVSVEENLRAEPNGTIIGQLVPGSRLRVDGSDGNWSRVTLEGAVWLASLQARGFGAFDLVVTEPGGENLREEPRGRILGRLGEGTLLEEVSREPGWARVRRTAWIWTPSLDLETEAREGATTPAPAVEPRELPPGRPPEPDPEPTPPPSPTAPRPAPGGAGGTPAGEEWVRAGPSRPGILTAPSGDTLALARPGADLRILGREGNWARVRMEGWIWLPGNVGGEAVDGEETETDVVLRDVDPLEISGDPERYHGRIVELELQFISVERAERIRTDFQEGEPFLLTRSVDSGRGFVYVAVPSNLLPELERLAPLTRIRVTGRVRTGAAALTGSPILDLMEFQVRR